MPGSTPVSQTRGRVERRVVELERALQVRVPDLELPEVEQRGAERPLPDHLQVRIAEPVEEVQHLERDVARRRDLPRDDVVRGQADEDRHHAVRIVHLTAQLARPRVRAADLRDGVALAGLAPTSPYVICSASSAAARCGDSGVPSRSASPRCASRAVSSCAYKRADACAAWFQYSAARIRSRADSSSRAMSPAQSHGCAAIRAISCSATARLSAARRVARSDSSNALW